MKSELEYVLNELAQYMLYGTTNMKNEYQKQEIVQLDQNITNVNKIYKEFKKIEQKNYWDMPDEEIFYRQAKYLENFEDNYEVKETHNSYSIYRNYDNTYTNFSFKEFRTYFSWRTKIRKGIFEEIDWEYEKIYINELVNKIGCKDANEAIEKLIDFWKGYRKCVARIDNTMPDIIKEFYISNTINVSYTEITSKYPIPLKTKSKDLKEIKRGIYNNKIDFLDEISTYKIAKSKFLETKYGYLLNECINIVFTKIHQEFEKNNISLPDMLVKKNEIEYWWQPLSNYTIYKPEKKDKEIIIEGTEKYKCQKGMWNRVIYSERNDYKHMVGYLLKTIECYIREYLGYRKLKLPNKNELKEVYYYTNEERKNIQKIYKMDLEKIIKIEIWQHLENIKIPKNACIKKKQQQNEFEKEEKIEVVFNQEQFAKIREKSEEIQKALVIEEEIIEKTPEKETIKDDYKAVAKKVVEKLPVEIQQEENIFKIFANNLEKEEKEIVQVLLQKQNVENKMLQIAQAKNEMLEVMVSNINDKALETIGDTIIESDMTSIYEDYEKEIKQVM